MPMFSCPIVLKKLLFDAGALDIQRVYESIRIAYYEGSRTLDVVLGELRKNQPELFTTPRKANWSQHSAVTYRKVA